MKTYVAEINGEAVMAFRAMDDDDAYGIANKDEGGLQLGLTRGTGLIRADGRELWDGDSEINTRPATEEEHQRWLKARDAEIGAPHEGIYLVPTKPVDNDED
jgi:hypothetical protein